MRRVEQKPALAGLFGTVFIWFLIVLLFYVSSVLLAPKQYKTIKIRLDSTSKSEKFVKKAEESSAQNQEAESAQPLAQDSAEQSPAPQEAAAAEAPSLAEALPPAPVPAPAQEVQVSKTESKNTNSKLPPVEKSKRKNEVVQKKEKSEALAEAPKKNTPQAEEQEQKLFKSIDELLAEQQSQKKTQKTEFDWKQFDSMEGNSSSSLNQNSVVKTGTAQSETPFSGESVASSSDSSKTPVSSKSDSNKKTAGSMSSDVGDALKAAFSQKNYSSSKGGVASTVTADTGTKDGKVYMKMEDGAARALLFPSEPKITLSEEASSLIDSKTTLIVSFTVRGSDGRILKQSIKFLPDILPSIVANEIREQISGWLFASPMSTDGIAKFSYTIQKQ
ncbi:MAG: hypothetical protein IJ727_06140 [Treponema sp.]|nr:hypothetical protein [Treponema sp.]